jgi:hypothetical protein
MLSLSEMRPPVYCGFLQVRPVDSHRYLSCVSKLHKKALASDRPGTEYDLRT